MGSLTMEALMPTYIEIADRVRSLGGGYVKTCWIAHVKSDFGLTRGTAPNRHHPLRRTHVCPPQKRAWIAFALGELGAFSIADGGR